MRNEHIEIDIESLMKAVESLSNEEKILLERNRESIYY